MAVIRASGWAIVALAYFALDLSTHAGAQENAAPSPVTDPQKHVDLAKFVQMPAVQRELKLTEPQITELVAIEAETKKHISTILRGLSKLEGDEKKAAFQDIQEELDLSRKLCADVFSPEQLHRAKQLALQFISRGPGNGFGILSNAMIEELKVTNEQAQTVRQKSAEIEQQLKTRDAEMKKEREALRIKLQSALIESLEPAQRARVKSLFGELISLEN